MPTTRARHGFTLKDRLVAHLPDYADAVSRIAGLANLRDRVPGLAWLSEKIAGFSARRAVAALARRHLLGGA